MCVLHWINSCWLSITYLVIFETQKHILPKYLLGSSAMCASENSASISATNSLFVFLIVLCGKQKRHLTVVTCLSRVSLERYLNLDVVVVTKKKISQSIPQLYWHSKKKTDTRLWLPEQTYLAPSRPFLMVSSIETTGVFANRKEGLVPREWSYTCTFHVFSSFKSVMNVCYEFDEVKVDDFHKKKLHDEVVTYPR